MMVGVGWYAMVLQGQSESKIVFLLFLCKILVKTPIFAHKNSVNTNERP